MEIKTRKELLEKAFEARKRAYSPYSGFSVGAALLCEDGEVFLGCNIENASFSPTCCAERVAIFKALSERHAKDMPRFTAIAVVGGADQASAEKTPCYPCGVCRQVMAEFMYPDSELVLSDGGEARSMPISKLLPYAFKLCDEPDDTEEADDGQS